MWLVPNMTEWMAHCYNILTTGDHGMNAGGFHGGTTADVREVPLYLIRLGETDKGDTHVMVSKLQIAATICKILEVEIPKTMKAAALV